MDKAWGYVAAFTGIFLSPLWGQLFFSLSPRLFAVFLILLGGVVGSFSLVSTMLLTFVAVVASRKCALYVLACFEKNLRAHARSPKSKSVQEAAIATLLGFFRDHVSPCCHLISIDLMV
jgi:hypothetical protein